MRQGETLARIGKMAELFDDFSPLQLFATGRIQDKPFTLVGRLQYVYAGGRWTEWIVQLDGETVDGNDALDGRLCTLSEDNGAYVFTQPYALTVSPSPAGALAVGATTALDGQSYTVTSNQQVTLVSAQGELPRLPDLGKPFAMVELRNDQGLVLSLDYGSAPPAASLGRSARLEDLQLTGLRDESGKNETGRGFNCPNCGAPVTFKLANSKTITCRACHSIIDLTRGTGGELQHAEQGEPLRPLIALGALGKLRGVSWQVVGFQHRMGQEPGDDEQFGWDEYLLYNKKRGFSFLVDASDGWNMVQPITGAPTMAENGSAATYLGKRFQQQYAYDAETSYVAGEFYWKVERGQKTFNRDFAAGRTLLLMERSAHELTWSSGGKVDSALIATAFKLDAKKDMFKRRDALPVSGALGSSMGCGSIVVIFVVTIVLLIMLSTCRGSSGGGGSSGGRSSGGSFGGYSSGGGHK